MAAPPPPPPPGVVPANMKQPPPLPPPQLQSSVEPSDWFRGKLQQWHKDLQDWHTLIVDLRDPQKRAARRTQAKVTNEMANVDSEQGSAEKSADNLVDLKKDDVAEDSGNLKKDDVAEDRPATELGVEKAAATNDVEQAMVIDSAAKSSDKKLEVDPIQLLEADLLRQEALIFDAPDICNLGEGDPLFSGFAFEDWALLTLRFEIHLLLHAFKRDSKSSDLMTLEQLAFYYNQYYKKAFSPNSYGLQGVDEVLHLIDDTVVTLHSSVESQLTDDLHSNDIFVRLTEEGRRVRQRRIDCGDAAALLQLDVQLQSFGLESGNTPVAPPGTAGLPPVAIARPPIGGSSSSAIVGAAFALPLRSAGANQSQAQVGAGMQGSGPVGGGPMGGDALPVPTGGLSLADMGLTSSKGKSKGGCSGIGSAGLQQVVRGPTPMQMSEMPMPQQQQQQQQQQQHWGNMGNVASGKGWMPTGCPGQKGMDGKMYGKDPYAAFDKGSANKGKGMPYGAAGALGGKGGKSMPYPQAAPSWDSTGSSWNSWNSAGSSWT